MTVVLALIAAALAIAILRLAFIRASFRKHAADKIEHDGAGSVLPAMWLDEPRARR